MVDSGSSMYYYPVLMMYCYVPRPPLYTIQLCLYATVFAEAKSLNRDLPYISVTDVISEVLVLIARLEKERVATNEALSVS